MRRVWYVAEILDLVLSKKKKVNAVVYALDDCTCVGCSDFYSTCCSK